MTCGECGSPELTDVLVNWDKLNVQARCRDCGVYSSWAWMRGSDDAFRAAMNDLGQTPPEDGAA